ncbi:hypothetical protein [uncultured Psychrobacter sp.]|uniref:hypothetical protein n=1 Tax=uncultured Psychrobacter sp. TaxID=259303 RepID=UPI0034591CDC
MQNNINIKECIRRRFVVSKPLQCIVAALLITAFSSGVNSAHASFESTDTSTVGTCPAGHKMYYVGANPPASTQAAPVISQALSWTSGNTTKAFTFTEPSGNKVFNFRFSSVVDLNSTFANNSTPPFFGSLNGATTNAINLLHDSPAAKTNHVLDVSVNRPVSKVGYKIQDLDSTGSSGQVPYIEEVDVSTSKGQLTFNNTFHTRNAAQNIVTAREGQNCGAGGCNIDATWNYNLADVLLNLKHKNILSQRNSPHAIGYSDFYFCLAPPKLIVEKRLNGTRVASSDQFQIQVTGGTIVTNSFTTTGTGSAISNGSNNPALKLAENTTYTVTERVINGDMGNYSANYSCSNATTGSTTVMPSGATVYNAAAGTRSFTLANTNYGDEITCTLTNSPNYIFSGTVFNDNGGISDAQANDRNAVIDSGAYNNTNYFNGVFNPSVETGIAASTVSLVNCANPSSVYATQTVEATGSGIGRYQIIVASSALAGNNSVCLIENNSNVSPTYPIRTTPDRQVVALTANRYSYLNNDFGRVIAKNVALVLEKEQAANNCRFTDFTRLNYSKEALSSSTTGAGADIRPGQCIAYKITATNRANVSVDDFVMQDTLQKKNPADPSAPKVTSVLADPVRVAGDFNDGLVKGQNGTIRTISLTLPKRSKRSFYFNTQYGSTQSN